MNRARNSIARTAHPRAPLALAAVAFGVGVWVAGHLHRPAWLWAFAAAGFVACGLAATAIKSIRLGYISIVSALICAGAFSRFWMPVPHLNFPPQNFLSGVQVEITGHVTDDGALLAGSEPRERFDLETETIQLGEVRFTQPVGIRASIFLKQSSEEDDDEPEAGFPKLAYGDRIKLT